MSQKQWQWKKVVWVLPRSNSPLSLSLGYLTANFLELMLCHHLLMDSSSWHKWFTFTTSAITSHRMLITAEYLNSHFFSVFLFVYPLQVLKVLFYANFCNLIERFISSVYYAPPCRFTAATACLWSQLTPRIAKRGGRRHWFVCIRCAPAASARLHSPPAWDKGCLEVMQRWYEIWSISTQHLDSLTNEHSERSMLMSVNVMECTLMEMVNFWTLYIKCQYFNDSSTDFH